MNENTPAPAGRLSDGPTEDFIFGHNNGVVAMWPNPNGRFAAIVRLVDDGKEHQAWVFARVSPLEGRVDERRIRVLHGNWAQLLELEGWFQSRKITWTHNGCAGTGFVPFSNGASKYWQDENGEWQSDYSDCDYACRQQCDPRLAIEAYLDAMEGKETV